jgi:hypothetical protein
MASEHVPFGSDLADRLSRLDRTNRLPNSLMERRQGGIMRGQTWFDDYDLGALGVLLATAFDLALLASI